MHEYIEILDEPEEYDATILKQFEEWYPPYGIQQVEIMGAYEIGILLPQSVLDDMNVLNAKVETFNLEQAPSLDSVISDCWKNFHRRWLAYYSANKSFFQESREKTAACVKKFGQALQVFEKARTGDKTAIGALVFTPQNLLDIIKLHDARARTLNNDVLESNVSISFKQGWQQFYKAWRSFYKESAEGFSGWWQRGWSSTTETMETYAKQIDWWIAALKRQGGTSTIEPLPAEKEGGIFSWASVALVGVGVALTILVLK